MGVLAVGKPFEAGPAIGKFDLTVMDDEPLILVVHGMPYSRHEVFEETNRHVHATLQARSDQAAPFVGSREEAAERREFALTCGWNRLTDATWAAVRRFLASDDPAPSNPAVARLLGLDSPVARMALGFALQMAAESLGEALGAPPLSATDVAASLRPVLAVVSRLDDLNPPLADLRVAVDNPTPDTPWRELIRAALVRIDPHVPGAA